MSGADSGGDSGPRRVIYRSVRAAQLWGLVREAFISNAATRAVSAFLELGQVR